MGLIASLPEIDVDRNSVFVMHEKSEKLIPLHQHTKGQLSYVEGGIAYITVDYKTYVVPARHYFWIPQGLPHILRIGYSATVLRSLYFYAHDDHKNPFYHTLGIYPASELLIQMINHTEIWDGKSVNTDSENFEFLVALKNLLPQLNNSALPISLSTVSSVFNISERTLSRLFQTNLHMSFLQYLKTLRIIKALEMLLKTNKSVSEIAYSVGYDTLGAFSNTFYAFTHSRPSDLRKTSKNS